MCQFSNHLRYFSKISIGFMCIKSQKWCEMDSKFTIGNEMKINETSKIWLFHPFLQLPLILDRQIVPPHWHRHHFGWGSLQFSQNLETMRCQCQCFLFWGFLHLIGIVTFIKSYAQCCVFVVVDNIYVTTIFN